MKTLIKTLGILVLPLHVPVMAMDCSKPGIGAYDQSDSMSSSHISIAMPEQKVHTIRVSAQFTSKASKFVDDIEIYDDINGAFIGRTSSKNVKEGRYGINEEYTLPTGRDSIIFRYILREPGRNYGDRYYEEICDSKFSKEFSKIADKPRAYKAGEFPICVSQFDKESNENKLKKLHAIRLNIVSNRLDTNTEKSPLSVKPICRYQENEKTSPIYGIVNFDMAAAGTPLNNSDLLKAILATVDVAQADALPRPTYIDCGQEAVVRDEDLHSQRLNIIRQYVDEASKLYQVNFKKMNAQQADMLINFFISEGVMWTRHINSVKKAFGWK